jgi:acetyl-CoA carboxylase beta subunit
MLDMVVDRRELKGVIAKSLRVMMPPPAAALPAAAPTPA